MAKPCGAAGDFAGAAPGAVSCAEQMFCTRGDTHVARPRPNAKRPCFIVSARYWMEPADHSARPASAARTFQPVFVTSSASPRRISKTVTTASTRRLHSGTTAPGEKSTPSEAVRVQPIAKTGRFRALGAVFPNCQRVFSRWDFRSRGAVALCTARLPPNRHRLTACDHFQLGGRWGCQRLGETVGRAPKSELRNKGRNLRQRNPRIKARQQRE